MNYFKFLALVFGLAAFLKPFYMHLLPWDEMKFIQNAYSEKRPGWIPVVVFLGFLWVIFSWYKYFTTDIPYSIVITTLFSLTLVKGFLLMFDYKKFQCWISALLKKDKGKNIILIDIFTSLFGLLILFLAIFVY